MDKEIILNQIRQALADGRLKASEVKEVADKHLKSKKSDDHNQAIVKTMSFIGGAVILTGIIIYITMNWSVLGSVERVLITLGVSILSYVSGVVVFGLKGKKVGYVPHVFTALGVILFPIGLSVLMYELDTNLSSPANYSLISASTTIVSLIPFIFLGRMRVFLFISIGFGTWFVVAFVNLITNYGQAMPFSPFYMYQWLTIIIGLSYMAFGYWFKSKDKADFSGVLLTLGSLGFFCGALAGGTIWDIIFPILLVGGFLISIYLKSAGVLVVSAIVLVSYIIKITFVHFPGAINVWPITLIALGSIILVVSYATYRINLYIKSKNSVAENNILNVNDPKL